MNGRSSHELFMNLETAGGSQKSALALGTPGTIQKCLITTEVTSTFCIAPGTPISYTAAWRPTAVSRFTWSKCFLVLAMCVLLVGGGATLAAAQEDSDPAEEAGLGVASALLTLPYGPAKIIYAGLGGIIGGATWVLTGGNIETAQAVWEPSFYGDYVITPDHLKGKTPLRFFGVSPYEEDAYAE